MSFSAKTLWPGALFIGGICLMAAGYRKVGFTVAGAPVLVGILVLIWAISRRSGSGSRSENGSRSGSGTDSD